MPTLAAKTDLLLADIRDLRFRQRERLHHDMAAIDGAYDADVQRIRQWRRARRLTMVWWTTLAAAGALTLLGG